MKLKQLLSRLSKRERAFVYATVVITFLAGTERLVLHPIVSRFNELDEEILLKESQLRKNLRDLGAREAVRSAYSRYAVYAVSAGSDEEEMARLLNEIEGVARKSGVSLVNLKPRPAVKIDVGKQYPVEVEVDSEMAPLIRFMHGLHSSKYLLRIKQLRLAPKDGRGAQVSASLLINQSAIQ